MYGEYYVTKFFTNADDIRLRINSLRIYTTLQRMAHTTKKSGKNKTDDSVLLVYVVYHFFFFLPFNFLINLLDSPIFFTFLKLNPR